MINYDWERIEWNTKTRTNDLYSSKSNTNSMYHFLCFTLYFTNHVMFFFFFFLILKFGYFIRKIKKLHGKLGLVDHKINTKNGKKDFHPSKLISVLIP